MAQHLGLKIQQRNGMCVTEGIGDRIDCPGLFLDLPLLIGSEDFMVDCYGHDVFLGVQFLNILGLTLWDFAEQTLCFQRGDRGSHSSFSLRKLSIFLPFLSLLLISRLLTLHSHHTLVGPSAYLQ